jgi:4'-phosphopantetheinyl transferase
MLQNTAYAWSPPAWGRFCRRKLHEEAFGVVRTLLSQDPAALCAKESALRVVPRSVQVWAFELRTSPACLEQCRQTLSSAEGARAARFVHETSRDDFVVAHGVLRQLLGRYTATPPRDLRFSSGADGKPTLEARARDASVISFNMTHSQGRALIAVSDGREIGIDLEKIKPEVKALAIARRYFARAELAAIEAAPAPLTAGTFFRYWVAKEAILKGQGIGLRFPIDEFAVHFDDRDWSARIRIREPSRLAADWNVQVLPVDAGWSAALAVRGNGWTLQLMTPRGPDERAAAV